MFNRDKILCAVPDSHGQFQDKAAAAATVKDIKSLNPDFVVMLGDHVDCAGFLAEHHTQSHLQELAYGYDIDIAAANKYIDQIRRAAPNAEIFYLEGNHEARVEKWCIKASLGSQRNAEELYARTAPRHLLRLRERGIRYVSRGSYHQNISLAGTIRIGKCFFVHEAGFAGRDAAAKTLDRFGASVVFGHVHSRQEQVTKKVATGEIGAWSPGCSSELQPLYMHTRPSGWTHGHAVQFISKNGNFQHVNVTIANGVSCLAPLMNAFGAKK